MVYRSDNLIGYVVSHSINC